MPRQNRVTPLGDIVAHPARGLLMGNRGCLHDDAGRIVRTTDNQAWISCEPRWPGVRRRLMHPGSYTELFFLDEATAMAAGHRPCGSCRPERLTAFKRAWAKAHRLDYLPMVAEMDAALRRSGTQHRCDLDAFPNGAMIADPKGAILLRWREQWRPWSHDGYAAVIKISGNGDDYNAITPVPMLAILSAGYVPQVHPSVAAFSALPEDAEHNFSMQAAKP